MHTRSNWYLGVPPVGYYVDGFFPIGHGCLLNLIMLFDISSLNGAIQRHAWWVLVADFLFRLFVECLYCAEHGHLRSRAKQAFNVRFQGLSNDPLPIRTLFALVYNYNEELCVHREQQCTSSWVTSVQLQRMGMPGE